MTGPADSKSVNKVQAVLDHAELPATVLGKIAYDPLGAGTLAGEWTEKLSRSWLMRSARDLGGKLVRDLDRIAAEDAESESA